MRVWVSAAAAIIVGLIVTRPAQAQSEQTDRLTRMIHLGVNGQFVLENVSGSIKVAGAAGDQLSIDAVKRTRGDRRDLDDVRIDIEDRNGRVVVRTVYPQHGSVSQRGGVWVDYTVSLPVGTDTELQSVSGSVDVTNVHGELRIRSVSGRVTMAQVENLDEVKSVSGPIEISDAKLHQRAEISVVGGRVTVRDVSGPGLDLKAVSGALSVRNSSVERLDASVISGSVDFSGTLPANARYELKTHSGAVNVVLPADAQFEVHANTFHGPIRSDFPGTVVRQDGRQSQSLESTVGRGGAQLTLRSFSGSISVAKP